MLGRGFFAYRQVGVGAGMAVRALCHRFFPAGKEAAGGLGVRCAGHDRQRETQQSGQIGGRKFGAPKAPRPVDAQIGHRVRASVGANGDRDVLAVAERQLAMDVLAAGGVAEQAITAGRCYALGTKRGE